MRSYEKTVNTEPSAVGQGTRIVLGNGTATGTLNYTGTGDTWSRNMKIGENIADITHTGGGVINNNGTGPLVITSAQSFTANGNATATRPLTFAGSNTNDNQMQMTIIDNSTANGGLVSVVKAGSGRWTLTGNNTYTGTTTVEGGTLLINGNQASAPGAVTVESDAILGGTGTLGGVLTVNNGGTLAPGASVGSLTIEAAAIIGEGAVYAWEFEEGVGDLVDVNGTLTLPVAATVTVTPVSGDLPETPTLFTADTLDGASDLGGWTVLGLANYKAVIDGNAVILAFHPPPGSLFLMR